MRLLTIAMVFVLIFSVTSAFSDTFYLIDDTAYEGSLDDWNDDEGKATYWDARDSKLYFVQYKNLKRVALDSGSSYIFDGGKRLLEQENRVPSFSPQSPNEPALSQKIPDHFFLVDGSIYEGVLLNWDDGKGIVSYQEGREGKEYFIRYLNLRRVDLGSGDSYLFNIGNIINTRIAGRSSAPAASSVYNQTAATFYFTDGSRFQAKFENWNDENQVVLYNDLRDKQPFFIKYEHLDRVVLNSGDGFSFAGGQRRAQAVVRNLYKPDGIKTNPPIFSNATNSNAANNPATRYTPEPLMDKFTTVDGSFYYGVFERWDDALAKVVYVDKQQMSYSFKYTDLKRVDLKNGDQYEFPGGRKVAIRKEPVYTPPTPSFQPSQQYQSEPPSNSLEQSGTFYFADNTKSRGVLESWNDAEGRVYYRDTIDNKRYVIEYRILARVGLDNGKNYIFKAGKRIPQQYEGQ
ncbi:MAG: hypothetical protein B6244_12250 [Candidatus Cloacimonetes bacterium 4572_55]|nr:MAG: hypothetical protein B6244_12250 [Candidatus Cloacimonetes bacterium 4572_55]